MQQIAQKQLNSVNNLLKDQPCNNDTFFKGRLGLVFYYYHLYRVTEEASLKHKMESLLEQVFANINSASPTLIGPSLSAGGAGLGLIVNFLYREGVLEFEVENEFAELDRYLFNAASDLIAEDNIDYLHGALGVVNYFAEKTRTSPQANDYLDELIEKVCSRAVREETGYWFRNDLMKVDGKQVINFSLSHGQCGILLVLVNAYPVSAHKELISEIVKGGIRFILKHKMDVDFSGNEYSFFPFIIKHDAREISAPNRMGWCYGDLNEVLLFYRAGKMFNDKSLVELADLIGIQSMMRKDEPSTMIVDSSFCHGAAGLAQFCKTLYRESNREVYKSGYEYWIEKLILFLDEELEKGTYKGKENEYLEGLIGTALTLLSYISDVELEWSKVMLL